MKRLSFLITFFCLATAICYAQSSDEEKYEQASNYHDAKEYEKAFPLLEELAVKNHAKALNLLGVFYNYGYSVPKNMQKAVELFQKSADLGWRSAQRNLGICYERGEGVPKDMEKAYSWYEKAFRQYKESADKGDADAQLEVGIFYYLGRMRSGKDYSKALLWFEKSSNQGNAIAANYLGIMYQYAYGVEKDVNKAYNYYLKGAEKGNCYAQRNLAWLFQDEQFGELHSSGEGETYHVDFDFNRQTEKWLRMAAQNNANFMYELARFYLDMQVSDDWQDKAPGLYLKKAADEGSAEAEACIGYEYLTGNKYVDAINMLNRSKLHGCKTFESFEYSDAKEFDVDVIIKICQFFKKNDKYNFKEAIPINDNILVIINEKDNKEGLMVFSNAGSFITQTSCMFKDLFYLDHYLSYKDANEDDGSYNNSHSINCINTDVDVDVLNALFQFFYQHKEYKFKDGIYEGGNHIFVICTNNEKKGFLKISKAGKAIASTSIIYDDLYFSNHDIPYFCFDKCYIYFIDSNVNLEVVFTLAHFCEKNHEYSCIQAFCYKNDLFVLLCNEGTNKYRWTKLRGNGSSIAFTPETEKIYYYDLKENMFESDAYGERNRISFQDMMSQFK